MKYLSLYKTSSEHSADQSRLTPNISLITDEKKMILTNENNNTTFFENVDILESFDDIINRFPTGNSTGMPGLKIYGDNTDQSKAKNIKLYNDALQWRSDYISNNGLSDTRQGIRINIDALMIDNIIMDKYDNSYNYYIDIYKHYISLNISLMNNYDAEIASVSHDGSVNYYYNIFPSPTETRMPYLDIYTDNTDNDSKSKNIKLYNDAQEWRKKYILHNGLGDTGQPISMYIDELNIYYAIMDPYDMYYHYHIDIYNDCIILLNERDSSEVLTIYGDGSVTIQNLFNRLPSATSSNIPGIRIYTDNSDQSKAENIKLYNDAQKWRKDHISYRGWSDTNQGIEMRADALIIDDVILGEFDDNYNYYIYIYNDHIILLNDYDSSEGLTIYSDGSVSGNVNLPTNTTQLPDIDKTTLTPTNTDLIYNKFPDPTGTEMPWVKIYTDNSDQSKENNIKLYNNAQEWSNNSKLSFVVIDALIIDDETIDNYDWNYQYNIGIYNDHIILITGCYPQYGSEVLTIYSDGSVRFSFNKFPSDTSSNIPGIKIYTDNTDQSKSNNIELYNNSQEWRDNYIIYNGWSDTRQGFEIDFDQLVIDDKTIDKYDGNYKYYIYIYNDRILLMKGASRILTISSDGFVSYTPINTNI